MQPDDVRRVDKGEEWLYVNEINLCPSFLLVTNCRGCRSSSHVACTLYIFAQHMLSSGLSSLTGFLGQSEHSEIRRLLLSRMTSPPITPVHQSLEEVHVLPFSLCGISRASAV